MTQQEFHIARRMFAVYRTTVLVAPLHFPYSHAEWLLPVLNRTWDDLARTVRGYILDERIVCYTHFDNTDFSHIVDHDAVTLALDVLEKAHPIRLIAFGAIPGPTSPWKTVSDAIEIAEYRRLWPAMCRK